MNTFSSITAPTGYEVDAWLITMTIKNLRTRLPFLDFCTPYSLGEKKGTKTARWFEFTDIDVPEAPTPFLEGQTNAPSNLTSTQTEVPVERYGVWVPLSDEALDLDRFGLLKIAADKVSRYIAVAVTNIVRNEFANTGTVVLANSAANTAAINTAASENDLLNIIQTLAESNVLPISKVISPSTMISTEGVQESYVVLAPQAIYKDLRNNVSTFIVPVNYGNGGKDKIHPAEGGAYDHLRFIFHNVNVVELGAGGVNAALRSTAGQVDVYSSYVLGFGAVGCTYIISEGLDIMEKEVMEGKVKFLQDDMKGVKLHMEEPKYSIADPYAQKAFVSGKFDLGVKILQEPAILRYKCGVSLI